MKLIRFGEPGREKPGLMAADGSRRDCSAVVNDFDHAFFNSGGLDRLSKIDAMSLPRVDDGVRWASPVARPGAIICIGLNYSDHAKESGLEPPSEPVVFMKKSNTIAGPFDDVPIPPGSTKTDWEVELAIVIGTDAYHLPDVSAANQHIAGYTIIHDISEREFQIERGGQWTKGKSCPGFSPLGPWLSTRDEIANIESLHMTCSVNGTLRQNGSTRTMIFKPAFIVQYLSRFMRLDAGDVIATGTPPGVGLGMKPPTYLKPGDVVELSIEGLGSQRQRFVATAL